MSSFPSSFFNPRSLRGRLVLSLTGIIAIYTSMYFLDANYLLDALLEIRGMNFTSLYSDAAILPLIGGLAASVGPFAMKMINLNFGFKRKKAEAQTKNNNNVQEVSVVPQAISLAASNGAAITSSSRVAQEKTQSVKNTATTAPATATTNIFRQSAAGSGNSPQAGSNGATTTTTTVLASIPSGIAAANTADPGSDDNNNNNGAVASQDSERILEEVENKIKPAVEEVGVIKQDVVMLKEDMSTIRTSIESLSSTLETSLVDLKAFQAEMVNPINFMRKYFDSMDIKALSDPSAPFVGMQKHEVPRQEAPPQQQPAVEATTKKEIINNNRKGDGDNADDEGGSSSEITGADHPLVQEYQKENDDDDDDHATKLKDILAPRRMLPMKKKTGLISRSPVSHDDTLAIKGMLESGITPGKIMSIVSVVDEILTTMGPDGVDLLVEQYKRLGLTEEDELVIYTILRLLNESKIYTEEIIALLYRFGQVLGINDKDAELQYTRLIANKARRRTARKPEADG